MQLLFVSLIGLIVAEWFSPRVALEKHTPTSQSVTYDGFGLAKDIPTWFRVNCFYM